MNQTLDFGDGFQVVVLFVAVLLVSFDPFFCWEYGLML